MWGVGSADIGLSPAGVASQMDVDDVALVVSEVYRTFFSRLYNHFWRVSSSSSCTNCVRTLQQCNFGLFGEEVATSSLQDLRAQHCSRRNFSIATAAEVKWLGARAVVRWRMTCCWLNIEYININPRTHTHTPSWLTRSRHIFCLKIQGSDIEPYALLQQKISILRLVPRTTFELWVSEKCVFKRQIHTI